MKSSVPIDPATIREKDKVKLIALYGRVCPNDVLTSDDPRRDCIAAEMLDIGLANSSDSALHRLVGPFDRELKADSCKRPSVLPESETGRPLRRLSLRGQRPVAPRGPWGIERTGRGVWSARGKQRGDTAKNF